MSNEAWSSLVEEEWWTTAFIRHISPPGYWKDKLLGIKRLIIIIRSDRYYIEPTNGGVGYLILKDYRLHIKFAVRIKSNSAN